MATLLQLVDIDDATVLFDFNDSTGANNPNGVITAFGIGGAFALQTPDPEFVEFNPDTVAGGFTAKARDPLKLATWGMRAVGTAADQVQPAIGLLGRLLRQGNRALKWTPDGSAKTYWIDFEPSKAPAIWQGQALELYQVLKLFDTPDGVPIALRCQPYLRGAVLDPAVNQLANSMLLVDLASPTGRPDRWTYDSAANISSESIDPGTEAYKFTIATSGTRNLQQVATGAAAPGDMWAGSFYAASTSAAVARFYVVVEFLDAGSAVLATATSAPISPGAGFQRLTVTTSAAPTNTTQARISLRAANLSASSVTCYWKNAQLEVASAASMFRTDGQLRVGNDINQSGNFGGRAWPFFVQGDAWTPGILQVKCASGETPAPTLTAVTIGRFSSGGVVGSGKLTDLVNRIGVQCESGTAGADTTAQADANASGSGNNMMETTYASNPTVMAQRVSIPVTTLLDSLRGMRTVYVRIAPTAASKHTVQLRWSAANTSPAVNSDPEVPVDFSNAATFGSYIDKLIGTIFVPFTVPLGQVTLELWSRRDSGTGNLRWDLLTLAPGDDQSALSRVYTTSLSGSEQWVASQFIGGASFVNPVKLNGTLDSAYVLAGANQACGSPPAAGTAWPVGHHRATFQMYFRGGSVGTTVDLAVRNITDNVDAVGVPYFQNFTGNSGPQTIEFDSTAGKLYQLQVRVTSYTNRPCAVQGLTHSFTTSLPANAVLQTDPTQNPPAVQQLDPSGNFVADIAIAGQVPMWAAPGLNVAYFHYEDVPINGFPQGQSILTRAPRISFKHAPRYFG